MNSVDRRLAWRMLRREWRSGDLRVFFVAIALATAAVAAVGFFTDRIAQVLALNANELLGGDLIISSPNPLPEEWLASARQQELASARTVEFPSMVGGAERFELAGVKAVSEGYPLRGTLRIADDLFAADRETTAVPSVGSVWAEARLLSAIGVQVGETVNLGQSQLKVEAVLSNEPARAAGNVFSIAPRLLVRIDDLTATGLIGPGSRVRYTALFAGPADTVAEFRKSVEKGLSPLQRMQGVEDARPEVRQALERARRFLGLAAMVSVVLASIAVALTADRFVNRHLDACAVMRCLGASQRTILSIYGRQIGAVALAGGALGVLIGYLAQTGLVAMAASVTNGTLPAPSMMPVLAALATAGVTVIGFAAPPLMRLRNVPTLRVLRREMTPMTGGARTTVLFGATALIALLLWQAGDPKLGMWVVLGLLGALVALGGLAWIMLSLTRRLTRGVGVAWRFGIANLVRRGRSSVVQVIGFGLGFTALLLLSVVRGDLLDAWSQRLPEDAPNRFLINIQPTQMEDVKRFYQAQNQPDPGFYPMVRGRLVAVNGKPTAEEDYADDRAQRLVAREFNLSFAEAMAADNKIVAGQWWSGGETESQWSVEEGLAKTLGLKMGDTLSFQVADRTIEAKITSLRGVEWDSFRVNFFVIGPPQALADFPATYITAFYLPEDRGEFLTNLLRTFPNITVIDVAAVMTQVRNIITRVSEAIEYVFAFTIAAGLVVLYASIHATFDERIREAAVLRVLGAGRGDVYKSLIAEFAVLGGVAGTVAAIAAFLVGKIVAEKFFDLSYSFDISLWFTGTLAGALVVGVAGILGTRRVVSTPPWTTLREVT